jgi:hypothetical protein
MVTQVDAMIEERRESDARRIKEIDEDVASKKASLRAGEEKAAASGHGVSTSTSNSKEEGEDSEGNGNAELEEGEEVS